MLLTYILSIFLDEDNELSIGATEEIWDNLDGQSMSPELIEEKLDAIKSRVIHSLHTNEYLPPLHKKLATKAASLNDLGTLFSEHPQPKVSIDVKQQIGNAVGEWYGEFRRCELGNDTLTKEREITTLQFYFLL